MSVFARFCRRMLSSVSVTLVVLAAVCATLVACTESPAATSSSSTGGDSTSRDLYCALCEAVMDEMESGIGRIEQQHAHTVQTAWRIDEKRRIPYARTESVLLQLLEDDVPPVLRLYGVSNHTGRQRLVRRHDAPQLDTAPLLPELDGDTHDSTHAADDGSGETDSANHTASTQLPYSPAEFTSTATLTSTLTALYERMIDSYLEDIMLAFHKQKYDDVKDALCVKTIRACRKGTTFEPFPKPSRQRQGGGGGGVGQGQTHTLEQINHTDL